MKKTIAFFALSLLSFSMFAAVYTSTAVVGVWDIGGSPGGADDIIINHDWSAGWTDGDVANGFTGTITVQTGASVVWPGSLANFSGTLTLQGTGTFQVTGAMTDIGGDFDIQAGSTFTVSGNIDIADESSGGSFNLNGSFVVGGDLLNEFNTWGGTGSLSVAGDLTGGGDIGSRAYTLPVELTSFKVKGELYFVSLHWQTAAEINNDYFEVQYSSNGVDFVTLDFITGNGNSTKVNNYSFSDYNNPSNGFYRLKQVDFDGSFEYSDIVAHTVSVKSSATSTPAEITQLGSTSEFYVVPNADSNHTIEVYNLSGQLLLQENFTGVKGVRYDFNIAESGLFIVNVSSASSKTSLKAIVE